MPRYETKLEAAKDLIRRGFKIFPIKEGAKAPPLVKDFPHVSEQCAEMVNVWWGNNKNNIGIHCKGLLVIDVDIKKGGYESLIQLEIDHELPATLEVETPSGGRHVLYSIDGSVGNSVNSLGHGIDIRSEGGYVVAPGSTVDGVCYRISGDVPIAQAPDWLITKCRQKPKSVEKLAQNESFPDQNSAIQQALDWLQIAPPAIEGQGGDAHTFATICKVRDFGVSADNALETILKWNERCEPPWDIDDLQKKIENAYRYAQNSAGTRAVENMFDIVPNQGTIQPESGMLSDDEIYGPDDIDLPSVLNNPYLVKGWVDAGSQILLFGHWGAGKTFIALHLAAHITAGQPWFGTRIHQGGVLYFGYEGPIAMQRRVFAIRKEYPKWDFSTFKLRPLRWPLITRNNAQEGKLLGQQKLETALKIFKQDTGDYPALIIIDPLRNALGGSDSDPDLTAPFLNYMQKLTKHTGCSVMIIHHPGHSDADRSRGDSGIEAHMDTVIKVDGHRGRIETRKQRDDPSSALYYKLKVVTLGEDADGDSRTTCVVEQVEMNALDPSLTTQQQTVMDALQEIAGDTGIITKSQFKRAAHGLESRVQTEIFDILIRKHYLVADGKHYKIGVGAAEIFG
jgi:hypothetical protein